MSFNLGLCSVSFRKNAPEEILKAMKITIRCIPFDQSNTEGECLLTGKKAAMDVIYSRCY